MVKNSNFFERLTQVIDFYNIKSINSFAVDYLNYDSSEKINRLKKASAKPSFDILKDISNRFDNINMNWLISGQGNMLNDENNIVQYDNTYFYKRFEELIRENQDLKNELTSLKNIAQNTKQSYAKMYEPNHESSMVAEDEHRNPD